VFFELRRYKLALQIATHDTRAEAVRRHL